MTFTNRGIFSKIKYFDNIYGKFVLTRRKTYD